MDASQFLNSFGAEPPAPVYLFYPSKAGRARNATFEPLMAERCADKIITTLIDPKDPSMKDLAFAAYYADETDPAEIVSMAQTMPFLTERRVILVHRAEHYESDAAGRALHEYLKDPNETTVLMLIASRLDQRMVFYKTCDKSEHVVMVGCPELPRPEVMAWARDEIEQRGKRIASPALNELVDRIGFHLNDVKNAIDQLTSYVGTEELIHQEDVVAACGDVAEEEVWGLTDAIAAGDTGKAVELLRAMLQMGKSEFEILGTLNWLLKTAYLIAATPSGRPRVAPFLQKKTQPMADRLGIDGIKKAFSYMMETEILLRSTGVDRGLAMELFIVRLAWPKPARNPQVV